MNFKYNVLTISTILFSIFLILSCNKTKKDKNIYPVIPKVNKLEKKEGHFELEKKLSVYIKPDMEDIRSIANLTGSYFKDQGVEQISVNMKQKGIDNKGIYLQIDPTIKGKEAYQLQISEHKITINASAPNGLFYGVQSLRQLISDSSIPSCTIEDQPRFPYRGMHLDVCRHFFSVKEIKQYLDQLAFHKMNKFHWHLTEDQGWRIEIKQYPKLMSIASKRKETLVGHYSDQPQQYDGQEYGGFYTQKEVKEIVAYAKERYIEVIPEIEMPGHAQAILAAYPELACTDGPFEVATKWGVFEEVLCPTEETFQFLENVLTEVFTLFSSKYIHIGGDECPKTRWKESPFCQEIIQKEGLKDEHELQSYFIKRMEKFINSKGKTLIGWDEILEGGLAPNATVMSWRGVKGGIEAAKQGHSVIMTPTTHCYFDYYQSNATDEPLAIGGLTTLQKVYNFEPVPNELTAKEAEFILGAQGNVWTEYIPNYEKLEYMAFPRICALSEVVWAQPEQKNWKDFSSRLTSHFIKLDEMEINYAKHFYDVQAQLKSTSEGLQVTLQSNDPNQKIEYSMGDLKQIYTKPILLNKTTDFKAQTISSKKGIQTNAYELSFEKHKAVGQNIILTNPPSDQYAGAQQGTTLIDGLDGGTSFNAEKWLGFAGTDVEAIIQFDELTTIKKIQIGTIESKDAWIYLPKSVLIEGSVDGNIYTKIGSLNGSEIQEQGNDLNIESTGKFKSIKVRIQNTSQIPKNNPGAGQAAWLFIDEIIIH